MSESPRRNPTDRGSRFEDEGVPDLQDGTPQQQWSEDPEEMPLPAEEPVASTDWGTTAREQREGEPLDGRLAREEPDIPDDDISSRVPYEAGLPQSDERGESAGDDGGGGVTFADDDAASAGRLVADDPSDRRGTAAPDAEPDVTGADAGSDGGGFSAEERAVRIEREAP